MLSLKELHLRAALFRFLRSYFFDLGFLEVDTPIRQPVIIPERHILPLTSGDWFLQASPELCMKRLMAAGCEKIFQICPCFRASERGRLHLEEFLMLEWYRTGADYNDLMNDCQGLLRFLRENFITSCPEVARLYPKGVFGEEAIVDLTPAWERLTVTEAFDRMSPVPIGKAVENGRFDELLVDCIEPNLGKGTPVFLYDYPVELASLARVKDGCPDVAERFELYIESIELANGFSELTDGREQRLRLEDERGFMKDNDLTTSPLPERFLDALDGLDTCAGIALGLDRLFMLILGRNKIDEVVSFAPSDL